MAKTRTKRGSKSRSRSKSQKGGWGGWARTTHVGPSWTGENGSNHFAVSKEGVPSGNPLPANAFTGPGMHQATRLVPKLPIGALGSGQGNKIGGGIKRSHHKSRSKRGGFVFGGFPQNLRIGWDNIKIGAQNVYRGLMGTNQLDSPSPWNQPALNVNTQPTFKQPQDLTALRNAANAQVGKIIGGGRKRIGRTARRGGNNMNGMLSRMMSV